MGVGVLKWCVVAVCCCVILAQLAASVPAPPEYDGLNDVADWWLASHGVERRGGAPSMRLRFGKRGSIGSWQQVSQRSEPSLRLRYGKRSGDEAEPLLDHEIERKDRTPALRLRFGKRNPDFGLNEPLDENDFIRQYRAPALRLRFGKRSAAFGQEEETATSQEQ